MLRTPSAEHAHRPGLVHGRALDLLLVLTGPQVYVGLMRDLGCARDEVEEWMTSAVLAQPSDP